MQIPPFSITYKNKTLNLSTPHIMGILNVTPDSFSDGGKFNTLDTALFHAEKMLKEGATIIDIGGESTRPNAPPVSESEELDRVANVVDTLAKNVGENVWLSIDTSSPLVIAECSKLGAGIWNDVRGLTRPNAIEVASKLNIPVMLMHMRGEPTTMNGLDCYANVINDVLAELDQRIAKVTAGGVKRENLIIDPGFGFAKNFEQNMAWLKHFALLHQFNLPVMIGISRKRSMGEVLRQAGLVAEPSDRDVVSMVAGLLAVQQGACIVRTHNVAVTKAGLSLYQAVENA